MQQRIHSIDMIRGLSILGILFVNITSFSWPELYDSFPSAYWNSEFGEWIHTFLLLFVQSSFYPVFALLFGLSMGFIFKSAINKGLNTYTVFTRRLLFLLIIGTAHALLIWHGDILMVYAILGFFLLPLYNLNKKTLFILGFIIWLLPNLLYAGYLFQYDIHLMPFTNTIQINEVISAYQSGIKGIWRQNFIDWLNVYNLQSIPFIFISIFPMFLIGLSIAKSDFLSVLEKKPSKVNGLLLGIGILGFSIKGLLPTIGMPGNLLFLHLSEAFGGPLVGFFYALLIIRFSSRLKRIGKWLSCIGRMSMTNYVFQSILGFLIYKVFHFYGETSPIINLVIAFVIVYLQIVFSTNWLKYHRFGPIEDIWKKFTYR